ncbi:MAG: GNAT family N-acetyltransferase [Elioraea sp.]|nr:GNAT family N-acetyltransferase [Elioraea sp.]
MVADRAACQGAGMTVIPDLPAILETPRLRLRPFRAEDLGPWCAMMADPDVVRFLGTGTQAGRPRSSEEAWTLLATLIGQWTLRGYGMLAVEERASGRFVGRAGIVHLPAWPEPELSYALVREAWGKGYATEACRAVLEWAWARFPFERLASYIAPGNTASERVAAKLGAVREGPIDLLGTPVVAWVHRRLPSALA